MDCFSRAAGYNAAFGMTAEQWSHVREAFGAALSLDAARRPSALADLPEEIRSEVESLLDAHEDAGDFLEEDPGSALEGALLGQYRVLAKIGEGGMGAVYLGSRSGDGFEQTVALKVIPALRSTPEMDRRFVVERGILAGLEHPNIVRMLDGGEFGGGRYFAMEYVVGTPITEHAKNLPIAARLQLFRTVCGAIHYAHRHLIVHRDIKASNILVTAEGDVKVLDFGIAKLLDSGAGDGALTRNQPMSLDCASPEQLSGKPITTATDIYSLGVLLYELLTGVSPQGGPNRTLDDAVRQICHETPAAPSTLNPPLSRDLDSIVLRAMRKDPAERYASADEFSADVDRFLNGIPVIARDATFRYVARKFIARHKLAVGAVLAGAVLLATAAGVAFWQAKVASAARGIAERRAIETRKLARAVIFDMQLQLANIPGTLAVRKKMIAQTVTFLESLAREAGTDSPLQIEMAGSYLRIGNIQGGLGVSNLGDTRSAIQSWRTAIDLIDSVLSREPRNPEALRLGSIIHGQLSSPDGVSKEERARHRDTAVALARKMRDARPADDLSAEVLGNALFTRALGSAGASTRIQNFLETLAFYQTLLDRDPASPNNMRNVALSSKYLATEYQERTEYAKALEYALRARALDEARLAKMPNDRSAALDLSNDLGTVGQLLNNLHRSEEAIETLRRNLAFRMKLAAADPEDALLTERVGKAHLSFATALFDAGDLAAAEKESLASLSIYEATPPAEKGSIGGKAVNQLRLGLIAEKRGRRTNACRWFLLANANFALYYVDRTPEPLMAGRVKELKEKSAACAAR